MSPPGNRQSTQLSKSALVPKLTAHAPPTPFNPARDQWDSYMQRFECFMETNDLLGLSDNRKRAPFLSYYGSKVFDTAKALIAPTVM